jgi:hypothetical protein
VILDFISHLESCINFLHSNVSHGETDIGYLSSWKCSQGAIYYNHWDTRFSTKVQTAYAWHVTATMKHSSIWSYTAKLGPKHGNKSYRPYKTVSRRRKCYMEWSRRRRQNANPHGHYENLSVITHSWICVKVKRLTLLTVTIMNAYTDEWSCLSVRPSVRLFVHPYLVFHLLNMNVYLFLIFIPY